MAGSAPGARDRAVNQTEKGLVHSTQVRPARYMWIRKYRLCRRTGSESTLPVEPVFVRCGGERPFWEGGIWAELWRRWGGTLCCCEDYGWRRQARHSRISSASKGICLLPERAFWRGCYMLRENTLPFTDADTAIYVRFKSSVPVFYLHFTRCNRWAPREHVPCLRRVCTLLHSSF